jgi:phospholipase C
VDPKHLPPSSVRAIGHTDQANHNYDLSDFDAAVRADNLPAVSYVKAGEYQDGHAGYSDPLDEQTFLVHTINELQKSRDWASTAVVIAYDDSDGWYDHVMSPITSPSAAPADALNGAGKCGNVPAGSTAYPDRCGYGPRQPLLIVSPYAKVDYVDHALTDQTSVLKFIEDNWQLGRIGDQSFDARAGSIGNMFDFDPNHSRAPKIYLDPTTGVVLSGPPHDNGNSSSVDTTVGGYVEHGNADDLPVVPAVSYSGKPAKLTLRCSTKGGGRKIAVSCTATGAQARTAVRFRIAKGSKILVTGRTGVTKGRVKITLRPKKSLKKGKYTLRIAISRPGGVIGITQPIRLT